MNDPSRPPRVLVTAGSKHGSTTEIAAHISARLTQAGVESETVDPEHVGDVIDYDAFVIGSAVYAGHWTGAAKSLATRIGGVRGDRPVWLFSSGPIGDPPKPEEVPVDVAEIVEATNPVNHTVFAGKVDKKLLSFGERAILVAVRAPEGDYRDWAEIETWADEIAAALIPARISG